MERVDVMIILANPLMPNRLGFAFARIEADPILFIVVILH